MCVVLVENRKSPQTPEEALPGASVSTVAAHQLPLFLGSLASQASVRLSPTIVPAVEASVKVGTSTTVRN
jgi:hypothetical protein